MLEASRQPLDLTTEPNRCWALDFIHDARLRHDSESIHLLGGNQLDDVRELAYPIGSVLGYRWPVDGAYEPRPDSPRGIAHRRCCYPFLVSSIGRR